MGLPNVQKKRMGSPAGQPRGQLLTQVGNLPGQRGKTLLLGMERLLQKMVGLFGLALRGSLGHQ